MVMGGVGDVGGAGGAGGAVGMGERVVGGEVGGGESGGEGVVSMEGEKAYQYILCQSTLLQRPLGGLFPFRGAPSGLAGSSPRINGACGPIPSPLH